MDEFRWVTEEREAEIVEYIAQKVHRYGMEVPAAFAAEVAKPLAFVGSSGMHFINPVIGTIFGFQNVQDVAFVLENRANLEKLICRLEELAKAEDAKRKAIKEAKRREAPRWWQLR